MKGVKLKMNVMYTRSKYGNIKTKIGQRTYASKEEAKRGQQLKLLESINEIKDLKEQVVIELQPSFKIEGKTIRAINYIADYTYYELRGHEWQYIVEDVKGFKTDIYKLKAKLFAYKFNFEIREYKSGKKKNRIPRY